MSVRVINEVLEESSSVLGARLVALVLADAAHPDGITWLGQTELRRRTRLSERAVRDGLRALEELDELESRKAQRGRRRINVYRVIVGAIGEVEPDYNDLPFALAAPFSRPADVAARREERDRQNPPVVTAGRPATVAADERQGLPVPIGNRQEEPSTLSTKTVESALADRKNELEQRVADVFDACTAHVEPAPAIPVRRREYARLVRLLVVEVGATPEEVERRANAYRKHETFGGVILTLAALVKWWHLFEFDRIVTVRDATEKYVRNVAHVLEDEHLVEELRDRVQRGRITREEGLELLELGRMLRHEYEREEGTSSGEADPLEDFDDADVRTAAVTSIDTARRAS